jgi:hypothetical protein
MIRIPVSFFPASDKLYGAHYETPEILHMNREGLGE